jgi:hypothetical protein
MQYRNDFIKSFYIILLSLCIVQLHGKGQSVNKQLEIIGRPQTISNISYVQYLNKNSEMILISELHNISCTYPILESVIKENLVNGYRYIIQEMPLSYSIVCNQYLENGDTSLLNIISASEEAKEFYKHIRSFSLQNSATIKPKFWGIDFELGQTRIKYIRAAISILLTKFSYNTEIQQILKKILAKDNIEEIKILRSELGHLLNQNSNPNTTSDEGLNLLRLFVNRNDEYFKHRDTQLYQNFKEIDSLLRKRDFSPKYIGSFGVAHVNTSLKNSFSGILSNDPYWENKINVIGTHYYQCISNYGLKKETVVNDIGVLPKSISKSVPRQIVNQQSPHLLLAQPSSSTLLKPKLNYSLILIMFNYPGETKNVQRIN